MTPVIYWHRHDLRLTDNPALIAAVSSGHPVIPVYILESDDENPMGGACKWWLHYSLADLAKEYAQRGACLVLKQGEAAQVLEKLCQETGATKLFWNRRYYASGIAKDSALKSMFQKNGIECHSYNSHLLFEPWTIKNKQGLPFQVFTRFWNTCLEQTPPDKPEPAPEAINCQLAIESDDLDSWALLPTKPDWAGGLRQCWKPGEQGAQECLQQFIRDALEHYKEERNRPDKRATSLLSPYLRFGEISPRQLWHATKQAISLNPESSKGGTHFLSEIGWREFSYHLLFHFPDLPIKPLRQQFSKFPWHQDDDLFKAWTKGQTGYPIVDAGMRQLWHTGWMHNRVRMIVASFLVKDLLLPWQDGAAWFWDTLVDADIANNSASWQWVAGCGADAAPYFRIFNPVLQGEKFDPQGDYVRKWVPELKDLPNEVIHQPWTVSPQRLAAANIYLGKTYPKPIIDHNIARQRALDAFQGLKTNED